MSSFGTSTNSVYEQNGAIGISNFGTQISSVGWRGVMRIGAVDLLRKKYDTDSKNPKTVTEIQKLFKENLIQNITAITSLIKNISA